MSFWNLHQQWIKCLFWNVSLIVTQECYQKCFHLYDLGTLCTMRTLCSLHTLCTLLTQCTLHTLCTMHTLCTHHNKSTPSQYHSQSRRKGKRRYSEWDSLRMNGSGVWEQKNQPGNKTLHQHTQTDVVSAHSIVANFLFFDHRTLQKLTHSLKLPHSLSSSSFASL